MNGISLFSTRIASPIATIFELTTVCVPVTVRLPVKVAGPETVRRLVVLLNVKFGEPFAKPPSLKMTCVVEPAIGPGAP